LLFAAMLFAALASVGALIAAVKLQGQPPPDLDAGNYLVVDSLERYHRFYGDDFELEYPAPKAPPATRISSRCAPASPGPCSPR
jgi:hypothetical protein